MGAACCSASSVREPHQTYSGDETDQNALISSPKSDEQGPVSRTGAPLVVPESPATMRAVKEAFDIEKAKTGETGQSTLARHLENNSSSDAKPSGLPGVIERKNGGVTFQVDGQIIETLDYSEDNRDLNDTTDTVNSFHTVAKELAMDLGASEEIIFTKSPSLANTSAGSRRGSVTQPQYDAKSRRGSLVVASVTHAPQFVYPKDEKTHALNMADLQKTQFAGCTDTALTLLASEVQRVVFAENQVIFLQNDVADTIGMVVSGRVNLYRLSGITQPHQVFTQAAELIARQTTQSHDETVLESNYLCTNVPYDCIGREMFFPSRTRQCCCICAEETTLLMVTMTALESMLAQDMDSTIAIEALFHSLTAAKMHNVFMEAKFLGDVSIEIREVLLCLLTYSTLPADTILFHQGDSTVGQPIYFIEEGGVNIYLEAKGGSARRDLVTLSTGATIGEVSLLFNVGRTASAATVDTVILHALPHALFPVFIKLAPSVIGYFQDQVQDQVMPLESIIENETIRLYLKKFLALEFSTENIELISAVRHFRKLWEVDDTREESIALAVSICDTYIRSNGDQSVNLVGRVREKIITNIETNQDDITSELFDEACSEIMHLMASDTYVRFRKSDLFKKCINLLGTRVLTMAMLGKKREMVTHEEQEEKDIWATGKNTPVMSRTPESSLTI